MALKKPNQAAGSGTPSSPVAPSQAPAAPAAAPEAAPAAGVPEGNLEQRSAAPEAGAVAQPEAGVAPAIPVAAAPAAAAPVAAPAPISAPPESPSVLAERQRGLEIRSLCGRHGMENSFAEGLVTSGATIDATRGAILDHQAARDAATAQNPSVSVMREGADTLLPAIQNALEHRCGLTDKMTDEAMMYRNMSIIRIAEEVLAARGARPAGLPPMELAQRALHSTSDLPFIFANVANKSLRKAFEASPSTWHGISRKTSAPDFKTISRVQLGEAPALVEVNESGEFERGTIGEAREQYALRTYGKILSFTRQAMINDDLSALDRLPLLFGRSAAELMSDTVWALITGNVVMGDGVALFDAAHSNIGTGVLAVAGLNTGRATMRTQTGINGQRINVSPKVLVVPAALETLAQQLTTSVTPQQSSNVNPFQGVFQQVVAEPRLDADSLLQWYLFTDPGALDVIEYAFLSGAEGPVLETREGFDVDGMELKARLDFGAAVLEFRGAYRSSGA